MNNEQQCAYPTGHDGDPGLNKLEAFTLSAMKGLASYSFYIEQIMTSEDVKNGHDVLAATALNMARATLSTLQNEQK